MENKILSRNEFYEKKMKNQKKKLYAYRLKLTLGAASIAVVSGLCGAGIMHVTADKKSLNDFAKNDMKIESYFENDKELTNSNSKSLIDSYKQEMLTRSKILLAQYYGMDIDSYVTIRLDPHIEKADGKIGGKIIVSGKEIYAKDFSDIEMEIFKFATEVTNVSSVNSDYVKVKKEYDARLIKIISKVANEVYNNGKSK